MDCRTFNRKLEDYLEEGLDFPGRFGMERHAQQCFACGKTITDAQRLSRMARNMKRVKAPAEFEEQLLARIQREGLQHRSTWLPRLPAYWSRRWSWRPIALGALALVLLTAGVFIPTRWLQVEPDGSVRWFQREAAKTTPPKESPDTDIASVPEESSDTAAIPDPAPEKLLSSDVVFPADESGLSIYAEPVARTGYVEYLVPGPGDRQIVMRLPKTIWMRYGQPSTEYYIRNVSH